MTSNSVVEIVSIIDQSGSMESIRDDAIGGYNTFLGQQQELGGHASHTLVLFDHRYQVPVDGVDIKEVPRLTRQTFMPYGNTALYDAIGRALVDLEAKNPEKAIIQIITDGAENCSKEFTQAVVKEKIKAAEARGWEVIFMAANIDAFAAGGGLGISGSNTYAFAANAQGVHEAFASMSMRSTGYRSEPIVRPQNS